MKVEIKWNSGLVQDVIETGGQQGLLDAANAVHRDSQQIAPIKSGALRRDSQVSSEPGVAAISYGMGETAAYATYQHKGARSDGTHIIRNHSRNGTDIEYLERPLNAFANSNRMLQYIANKMKF